MTESFSVCQFFRDGTYEYVRRGVPVEEAVNAAIHYCTSIGARLGFAVRVIVTDSGDSIAFEWKREEGIVFGVSPDKIGMLKGGVRASQD